MSYFPEPWSDEDPDAEIAQDMSAMEALDPPFEPAVKQNTSLFRRYWKDSLETGKDERFTCSRIVVRDDMLSAAWQVKIRRLFGPQETQSFGQKGTHDRETPIPPGTFRL